MRDTNLGYYPGLISTLVRAPSCSQPYPPINASRPIFLHACTLLELLDLGVPYGPAPHLFGLFSSHKTGLPRAPLPTAKTPTTKPMAGTGTEEANNTGKDARSHKPIRND